MSGVAVSNVQFNEFGSPYKSRRKDIFDVGCDLAAEKPYTFLKIGYVFPELLKKLDYLPSDNASLNNACLAAKLGKLSRSPFEFIKSTYKSMDSLALWMKGENKVFKKKYEKEVRKVAFTDVLRDVNSCVNPVWEMADFLTKAILFIPKHAIKTLEGVNGGALVISMTWSAVESLNWIAKIDYSSLKGAARDKKFTQMTGHLLKLAMNVSYIALGVIIVLSTFFQFVFAPLLFSALSASALVFTILDYYHENLGTEKKIK